jgi:hypothetical protein
MENIDYPELADNQEKGGGQSVNHQYCICFSQKMTLAILHWAEVVCVLHKVGGGGARFTSHSVQTQDYVWKTINTL